MKFIQIFSKSHPNFSFQSLLTIKELSHSTVLSSNKKIQLKAPKVDQFVKEVDNTHNFQILYTENNLWSPQQTGVQLTSQHRLEVLFCRTPYADTFRYIQRQNNYAFKAFSTTLITFYIHTIVVSGFFIRDINNEQIALFSLSIFPQQETPKMSALLYTDTVFTINLDVIQAPNDILKIY